MNTPEPFHPQLLKWVGSKQRFAPEIIRMFPDDIREYREPFLGAGGVLGTLAPRHAVASDILPPLMEIWTTLHDDPELLKHWYASRRDGLDTHDMVAARYRQTLDSFNRRPNGADFLFLTRACYGGVIRFRRDGRMSTPCGPHTPMPSKTFARRVDLWHARVRHVTFHTMDYRDAIADAQPGDLVYCDPPYADSQKILYGAQAFRLEELFDAIDRAKSRGVRVALSIDKSKKNGLREILLDLPHGLFETEAEITVGRSMLHRFQMPGQNLDHDKVKDRLLLTYTP